MTVGALLEVDNLHMSGNEPKGSVCRWAPGTCLTPSRQARGDRSSLRSPCLPSPTAGGPGGDTHVPYGLDGDWDPSIELENNIMHF